MFGVKFIINEFEKDDYDEEVEEDEEELNDDELDKDDSDEEMADEENEMNKGDVESKCFIFSCLGIGLKNVARIEM